MERTKIINHEIGHGIIAYLFHNHYHSFEGIKLNPETKFNKNDCAYTGSRPLNDIEERVNQSGIDDVIVKPFLPDDLHQKVLHYTS